MISCSFACLLASLLKLFMDLYFEAGSTSDFSQRSSSAVTAMSNHLFSNRIIPAINLKRDRLCCRYIGQLVRTRNARTFVSATNYIANNWPSRVFIRCSVFSWKTNLAAFSLIYISFNLEALVLFSEPAKSNGQRGNLIWMTMDLYWIYESDHGFSIEHLTVDFRLPWIFIWIPGHKFLIETWSLRRLIFCSKVIWAAASFFAFSSSIMLSWKNIVQNHFKNHFRRYLWFSTSSCVLGFVKWNHPDLQQNLPYHVEHLSLSLSLLLSLSLSLS